VYESIDRGVFNIPLKDIENLRLGALGLLAISVNVAARIGKKDGVLENIPYSLLNREVEYTSDRAYVALFEFKPRKCLDLRRGRRKIFYRDVLKAYFKALEKANELDPPRQPI
jgi:hypothetical protein